MPRASRYLRSGYTYHLTQRCHDRAFLLRFARDRDAYREWLRVGTRRYRVPIYGYSITCNHVHVIARVDDVERVGELMRLAAGAGAQQYNRRKGTSGPFWEDSYHCTIVESGRHLWNCLLYVDLNMVRAGVVQSPSDWRWCGYAELASKRRRYRILDIDRLLESLGQGTEAELNACYRASLEERLAQRAVGREPQWTQALAVGSLSFVSAMRGRYNNRSKYVLETHAAAEATWSLREGAHPYGTLLGPESGA